jgi:adenosylcobinamide-phosphate synthase
VVCGPWPTFAWGALTTAVVVGAAWLGARQAEALAERLPAAPRWLLAAWLLKTTLSLRTLLDAAERVRRALARGDLAGARAGLRWLVSRETDDLPPPLLAAAAIESVAENLSDSLVAPLLAYALGGLPGAFAYRAANTLDAMLGYRGRYEWLGKVPARLDDALNLLPARLTAGLLALAAGACGLDGRAAARIARRDGPRTPSPNAGWPMAAMAGALGLELEKRGHYVLGQGGRLPSAGDIRRAEGIALGAAGLATLLALALARLGARA